MPTQLPESVRQAEEAVCDLVNACRKRGALYNQHPKEAAQVSRTAKWLLNALAALRRAWDDPCASQGLR